MIRVLVAAYAYILISTFTLLYYNWWCYWQKTEEKSFNNSKKELYFFNLDRDDINPYHSTINKIECKKINLNYKQNFIIEDGTCESLDNNLIDDN